MTPLEGAEDISGLLAEMELKKGPLANDREWVVVDQWDSFSARFVLIESGDQKIALKLGTNWDSARVVFVAEETERVRDLLATLPGGGVTMPEIYGVLTDPPALAISFVDGSLLFERLSTMDDHALTDYLSRCGRAIGAYHRAQPGSAVGSPVPFSADDLLKVAKLSGVSRARADALLSSLHNARRYQFSPNDILVDAGDNVVLLDPPHFSKYDYIHRDLATAFVELHRRLIGARRPSDEDLLTRVELGQEAFMSGYRETGPITIDGLDDSLAIGLFSISRVLGVAWGRLRSGRLVAGLRALGWALWIRGRLPGQRDLE